MCFITIAVQCHNYQKRFCWMLSSLAEQSNLELFVVDVAHMENNGRPSTESVVRLFAQKIHVRSCVWSDYSVFQRRGLVRNCQLKECATEWILFADCDMVYHPEYFARLMQELKSQHCRATYMLSSGRISTPKEEATALVNSIIGESPVLVQDAFVRAGALPKVSRANVGAGFSQIINVKHAPHEGHYVDPQANNDWAWETRFHKTRSDQQFRKRIARLGGNRKKLSRWFSENLIHLNHNRDKEFGHHLEEQR